MKSTDTFYEGLPKHRQFDDLLHSSAFVPLPDDWVVCCSDIVDSTGLIAAGRYKLVNMVGASVIAAMQNAMGGTAFPYVFGGDGTSFAVPPAWASTARITLARLRHWVGEEFNITLRVAAIAIADIRQKGLDVRVARHAVSPCADYAMFDGGGIAWAESQMKQGTIAIPACAETEPPDLTGLTCRWNTIPARNGLILSLVILPGEQAQADAFSTVVSQVLNLAADLDREGHPVPIEGPEVKLIPEGLEIEARLSRGRSALWRKRLLLKLGAIGAGWLFQRRQRIGQFDPNHYLATMSANADFRKFEDGLKMTLDCTTTVRDRIYALLMKARMDGIIRFGLHEQAEARLTCIVPSATRDDHVHFVDGAEGGYTRAARNLDKPPA